MFINHKPLGLHRVGLCKRLTLFKNTVMHIRMIGIALLVVHYRKSTVSVSSKLRGIEATCITSSDNKR